VHVIPSIARVTVLFATTVAWAALSVLVDFPEHPTIKATIRAIKNRFFI